MKRFRILFLSIIAAVGLMIADGQEAFSALPLPSGQRFIVYTARSEPVVSPVPDDAKPVGIGDLASGGSSINLRIKTDGFSGPVDIYLGFKFPETGDYFSLLKPGGQLQQFSLSQTAGSLSAGMLPPGFEPFVSGSVNPMDSLLLNNVPVSQFTPGKHSIYVMAAPSGTTGSFYLWMTEVTLSENNSLTVHLDSADAESALIDSGGGTISTTTADGTIYTLTIPPKALLSPQTITITPVSAMEGLPLSGGMAAAVHLEPEGLLFLHPVNLTIEFSPAVSAADLVGFGYDGRGERFYLNPYTINGTMVEFTLTHFSGYGVGFGTSQDIQSYREKNPGCGEEVYINEITAVLSKAQREGRSPTHDPEIISELYPIFQRWYDEFVRPGLQEAASNDKNLDCAIKNYLTWAAHKIMLLGIDELEIQGEGWGLMMQGLYNAVESSYNRCLSDNDAREAKIMLGWMAKLGSFLGEYYDPMSDFEKVRRCFRFKLELESEFVSDYSMLGSMKQMRTARAEVPLIYDESMLYLKGSGQFSLSGIITGVPDGDMIISTTPSTLEVPYAYINLNATVADCTCAKQKGEGEQPIEKDSVLLALKPGPLPEIWTYLGSTSQEDDFWNLFWELNHWAEYEPNFEFFVIKDWAVVRGGKLLARKIYTRQDAVISETTILNLWHDPQ